MIEPSKMPLWEIGGGSAHPETYLIARRRRKILCEPQALGDQILY